MKYYNNTELSLVQLLRKEVAPPILEYILFLNEFECPADFLTCGNDKRGEYYREWKPKQVPPTQNNMWVWFGSYRHTKLLPVFYNFSVSRHLFEKVTGTDIEGQRLMRHRHIPQWDVNPYRYYCKQYFIDKMKSEKIKNPENITQEDLQRATSGEAFRDMQAPVIETEHERKKREYEASLLKPSGPPQEIMEWRQIEIMRELENWKDFSDTEIRQMVPSSTDLTPFEVEWGLQKLRS